MVITRPQIRSVFRRNRGAKAQLARELGVTAASIHSVILGIIKSEHLVRAVRQRAMELRASEER